MKNEKIQLWGNRHPSRLTLFLLPGETVRSMVLVIPGGGYQCVCTPSEGTPIARKFNQLGFHAAVLEYRVAPNRCFPAPLEDAIRAMQILRGNAVRWHVKPHGIAACGFSAGGHLAACLGTAIAGEIRMPATDVFDAIDFRPDFLILCYGVVSFFDGGGTTADNLLGLKAPQKERMHFSPERRITAQTPPAFLWHTCSDQVVDYRCSVRFAEAMAAHERPCELHLFPRGNHGMLLGLHTPDVVVWPALAKRFIRTHERRFDGLQERYTNPYQCFAENAFPGPSKIN